MTLEELKKFLEENKDNQEIMGYLRGLILTPEGVAAYLDTAEGKKIA